jgi:hypothetical protein
MNILAHGRAPSHVEDLFSYGVGEPAEDRVAAGVVLLGRDVGEEQMAAEGEGGPHAAGTATDTA